VLGGSGTADKTNLEVLVRGLLPLLGHGAGSLLAEHTHGREHGEGGTDTDESVEGDLLALIRRTLGTGTVRTERNPVCCEVDRLALLRGKYILISEVDPKARFNTPMKPK
jgi:hypothetical protein